MGFWGGLQKRQSFRLGNQGLTLVELMIAVGLFGVLAAAMMALSFQNSLFVVKNQNEGSLSEDQQLFSQYLENYLGNATLIGQCGCGGGCVYDEARECTTTGACALGPNPFLTFEYEDAIDPTQRTAGTAGCMQVAAGLTDGLIQRGCKKIAQLVFTPPTSNGGGGAFVQPTPGRIQLLTGSALATAPATATYTLGSVSRLWCGQVSANSRSQFKVRVGMKARNSNLAITATARDSWHPNDPEFGRGTYREVTSEVSLRNLSTPGVMYGKAVSTSQCVTDGAAAPSPDVCCSGYSDSDAAGTCLATPACVIGGVAAGADAMCCSHRRTGGTCL